MLGERRSNSLFAPAAPAEPERKPEQAEVHDISFEERTGRSLFAEAATAPRASELFFAPQEKGVTFAEALSQVQGYLSETYATLITEDNSDAKEQMKRRMTRYLQENRIAVDGMTASELVDALYTETARHGHTVQSGFYHGVEVLLGADGIFHTAVGTVGTFFVHALGIGSDNLSGNLSGDFKYLVKRVHSIRIVLRGIVILVFVLVTAFFQFADTFHHRVVQMILQFGNFGIKICHNFLVI